MIVLASVRSTVNPSAPANLIPSVLPALSVNTNNESAAPVADSSEIE